MAGLDHLLPNAADEASRLDRHSLTLASLAVEPVEGLEIGDRPAQAHLHTELARPANALLDPVSVQAAEQDVGVGLEVHQVPRADTLSQRAAHGRQLGPDLDSCLNERAGELAGIPTLLNQRRAMVGKWKRDQAAPASQGAKLPARLAGPVPSAHALHHEHEGAKAVRLSHRLRPGGEVEGGRVRAAMDEPQPIRIVQAAHAAHPLTT